MNTITILNAMTRVDHELWEILYKHAASHPTSPPNITKSLRQARAFEGRLRKVLKEYDDRLRQVAEEGEG